VTDFRLIAVAADKPFARRRVRRCPLRTLWHEPFGRPLTWAWTVCVNPRDSTVNACLRSLAERAGSGAPPVVTSGVGPRDVHVAVCRTTLCRRCRPRRAGPRPQGFVTVVCPGTLRVDPFDAASVLPFHCVEAGSGVELPYERFVVSVKRVFLRSRDKNENPRIDDVTWDGRAWPENEVRETGACTNDTNRFADCENAEEHTVGVRPAPGSAETGVDELGVPYHEQLVLQHYATEGIFQFDARTGETAPSGTKWAARSSARGKELIMWFVLARAVGA
jgi:hypothetical protein